MDLMEVFKRNPNKATFRVLFCAPELTKWKKAIADYEAASIAHGLGTREDLVDGETKLNEARNELIQMENKVVYGIVGTPGLTLDDYIEYLKNEISVKRQFKEGGLSEENIDKWVGPIFFREMNARIHSLFEKIEPPEGTLVNFAGAKVDEVSGQLMVERTAHSFGKKPTTEKILYPNIIIRSELEGGNQFYGIKFKGVDITSGLQVGLRDEHVRFQNLTFCASIIDELNKLFEEWTNNI